MIQLVIPCSFWMILPTPGSGMVVPLPHLNSRSLSRRDDSQMTSG
ncbi:hypothetical protein AH4AK4_2169 [Aeromonas hydrophila 4AK4]|nr:hypothetical protein AH4AK4_2169 [Aeromonas hydrophila 4AK4]